MLEPSTVFINYKYLSFIIAERKINQMSPTDTMEALKGKMKRQQNRSFCFDSYTVS